MLKRKIQYIQRTIFNKNLRAIKEASESLQVQMPSPFKTAAFNFTVDFELIWGNGNLGGFDHPIEKRINEAKAQSKNFHPFVNMLENLNMPSSWAILGKLANLTADKNLKNKFSPEWSKNSSWYLLPENIQIEDKIINGTEYLETLKKLKSPKEFITHGHAHIDYADKSTTLEISREDLQLSITSLEAVLDTKIQSFVFPCNKHAHYEILDEANIHCIRGKDHQWIIEKKRIHTPLGFWISPGAMSFKELKPHLELAIKQKCWIHPWMHMIECDLNQSDLETFYYPLFEFIINENKKGNIEHVFLNNLHNYITG